MRAAIDSGILCHVTEFPGLHDQSRLNPPSPCFGDFNSNLIAFEYAWVAGHVPQVRQYLVQVLFLATAQNFMDS